MERWNAAVLQHLIAPLLQYPTPSWFRAQGDETNAAKVDLSRSKWHGLRDQSFKDQLDLTLSLAHGVTTGPQAAAAAEYGITAAKEAVLDKEIKDYAAVMASPQASIADRKSLTGQMRTWVGASQNGSMGFLPLAISRAWCSSSA